MYFNQMELKAHYEMKKEQMEKAILKNKATQESHRTLNCCDIKIQELCCAY